MERSRFPAISRPFPAISRPCDGCLCEQQLGLCVGSVCVCVCVCVCGYSAVCAGGLALKWDVGLEVAITEYRYARRRVRNSRQSSRKHTSEALPSFVGFVCLVFPLLTCSYSTSTGTVVSYNRTLASVSVPHNVYPFFCPFGLALGFGRLAFELTLWLHLF
ncbi:uncharacterized protein YALI1_E19415g [Yarrowia lipolytica]|uniref:Uncharacterized protein n=1 Tax=Yarrowia lipolytica TaxID=4952 RepID=A0A1D8NIM1_YARLL|nr:hypothetical protein YALI1_E19415g [Yarrowia lipolytica]